MKAIIFDFNGTMIFDTRISACAFLDNSILELHFNNPASDDLLSFAVVVARSDGKWVLCKHKGRITYECPGGHREEGEKIEDTARRELYEETGAL